MNKAYLVIIIGILLFATNLNASSGYSYTDKVPVIEISVPEPVFIGADTTIEVKISNIEEKSDHQIRLDVKDPAGEETVLHLLTESHRVSF